LRLKTQRSKKDRFGTNTDGSAAGFTIIEVVVAIALMSTTMTAVFYALRACSKAAHHTRMLTVSVLLAESLLVEARLTENTAFETREGQNGSYSWKLQIASTPVENLGVIHVQVGWQEQQRQQQYELFSLIQMKSFTERK
jgi:prepilin-type N-terminal cleavage/methylation domain-containing protein